MTVLYLTEPGSTLASSSRTLVVRRGGQERAQVPALGLERVVVLAPSHLTSGALALCMQEQVELVVVSHGARVMARLGASPGGLATLAAQHRRAADAEFCLDLARAVVRGKVRNQRRLLGRSAAAAEAGVAATRAELHSLLERSARAETVAALRGVEGRASAVYFRALRQLVNPEFGFRGRNRRPPRDAANAMLSFGTHCWRQRPPPPCALPGWSRPWGFTTGRVADGRRWRWTWWRSFARPWGTRCYCNSPAGARWAPRSSARRTGACG